jgi:ElaB/YqjD/DUF883 family membrane-anchored ribosome-binding protein
MDAQSEQIIKDIQEKRARLGDNLTELETRVRDATDWRTYYNRNPWIMMGAAVAGGLLMAAMFTPSRRRT